MNLKPAIGITAGLTVLHNTRSGAVFVSTKATEETQCQGENRNHIKPIGDLTIKIPDPAEILREFTQSVLHGDEDHKNWLSNECENFIIRKCL